MVIPTDIVSKKLNRSKGSCSVKMSQLRNDLDFNISVLGGGLTGQSGAVRLGISKALVLYNESLRSKLKPKGLLTRDSRIVESKKYGMKKARRGSQFSKW